MTTPHEAAERLADSFNVDEDATGGRPSQATQIVDMALQAVSLWHSDEGDPFATMEVNGHRENRPLRSREFRNYLDFSFYRAHKNTPHSQARQAAIDTLCGIALYDSPEHKIWTRIAEHSGSILLDLGDEEWKAVAIRSTGWTVITDPPVKFRRPKSMRPIPVPFHNGSVDDLRRFLNLDSDADWVLIRAWLVQSVFATGPYPIMTLYGEAGSAKSTAARILKSCVDPTIAPLRSQPRSELDLLIAALNSWTIALDNLSSLSTWLSDALCRLATGGGLGTRQFYTNAEESLFDVQRPVILNGITSLAERGDLQDRCIPITLPVIDEDVRRTEGDFWQDFAQAHPAILGGLLDVVSGALRELPAVKLDRLPRMADFARRAVAAEKGQGWVDGTFMAAYAENRAGANDTALEASPVAGAIVDFMASRDEWSGTATELLAGLNTLVEEATTRREGWPVDGAQLGKILRRIAPNLRRSGTDVQLDTPRRRMITIRKGRDFAVITDMPPQEPQEDGAIGADGHDSNVGSDSTSPITATVHAHGGEGVERPLHDSTDSNDSKIHNLSNEEVLEF
jgi:hypothetical protein